MAVGGVVSVTANVGGTEQTRTAPIAVSPRNWNGKTIAPVVVRDAPGTLTDRPPSEHELGATSYDVGVAVPLVIIDHGPNTGFWFFTDIPATVKITIEINTAALAVGSEFWKNQDPARSNAIIFAGAPRCTRSDVVPIIPMVEAHEDLHRQIFVQEFSQRAAPFFETRVGRSGNLPGVLDDLLRFRRAATAESARVVDSTSANPFRPTCTFRYGPYPSK